MTTPGRGSLFRATGEPGRVRGGHGISSGPGPSKGDGVRDRDRPIPRERPIRASGSDPAIDEPSGAPVPVIVHLSGSRRGTTLRLRGRSVLRIGSGDEAEIRVEGEPVGERHATLFLRGSTYEIRAGSGHPVWVNGERTERLTLQTGDLLEVGEGGPALRFRLYPPGSAALKSVTEVFADCLDCARYAGPLPIRGAVLLGGAARELATQATWRVRATALAVLVLLLGGAVALALQGFALDRQEARVVGIEELLDESGRFLTPEDLDRAVVDIERRLASASSRLDSIATRPGRVGRMIATSGRSVVYLQGAYGFVDEGTGRPLRHVVRAEGEPIRAPLRGTVTFEGDGPVVETIFSGTGFVVDSGGALLTNHHVAVPWDYDDTAKRLAERGVRPALRRFVGYLPGRAEPFSVRLARSNPEADLALLHTAGATGQVAPLRLRAAPPKPGDDVVVMGYPTGIRAIMARADRELLLDLRTREVENVWEVLDRLAAHGDITPLSTRGIVGQVTSSAIVYDAETAPGGSGGPVLDADGNVVAINGSILVDFGGSNMGVPARLAVPLLETGHRGPPE